MRRLVLCTLLGTVLLCGVAAGSAVDTTVHPDSTDGNVTMYRAHDSTGFETAADIQAGIENGTIENVSGLLVNETLVVEIESGQLAAELEAENASPSDAFFGSSEVGATARDVTLSGDAVAPGLASADIPLGPENTTVRRSGNVTYVLVDSRSVDLDHKSLSDVSDLYTYSIQVDTGAVTLDSDEPAVRFHRSELEVPYLDDGDPLPAERIQRHVNVNIGTTDEIEVRLELEDGETRTTAIDRGEGARKAGGFSFDLGGVDHGTAYTLEFRRDGRSVRTMTGSVLEPYARLEVQDANATGNESRRNGSTAIEAAVNLSHGGEVRVTDSTSESALAVERVRPGEKRDLTLALSDASTAENRSFYIHLEREPPALDAHYPDCSPAAIVHENGSVTQYVSDFEVPTAAIVDDSTNAENTTPTADGVADEPSEADGIPGFTVVVTATVILVFARRISRHA